MMTRKQHVDYWLHGASENMKDMRGAIKSKRRVMAMFCGHLAVEKMLKGLCAVRDIEVWRDHKLLNLADNAGLISSLTGEQLNELATITSFKRDTTILKNVSTTFVRLYILPSGRKK